MIGRCVVHLRAASWRRSHRQPRSRAVRRQPGRPGENAFAEHVRLALHVVLHSGEGGPVRRLGVDLPGVDLPGGYAGDDVCGGYAGSDVFGADAYRRLRGRLLAEARARTGRGPGVIGPGVIGPGVIGPGAIVPLRRRGGPRV